MTEIDDSDLSSSLSRLKKELFKLAWFILPKPISSGSLDIAFLYSSLLPSYYHAQANLPLRLPKILGFFHFLILGSRRGLSPTPLFDPQIYFERARKAGIPIATSKQATFMHWFRRGYPRRILPTLLFDEGIYSDRYPSAVEFGQWAFRHFIRYGFRRGYRPNSLFHTEVYAALNGMESKKRAYMKYLASKGTASQTKIEAFLYRMRPDLVASRFRSGALKEALSCATAIEPIIAEGGENRPVRLLPYSVERFPLLKQARKILPRDRYDTIVCIPHCRLSGAALVAAELCKALRNLYPDETILLLRTERDVFTRPDWFPQDIDSVEIATLSEYMRAEKRHPILLDILIGARPKRIFNVNSRLAWEVFATYANRLKLWSELYAYMFCWDYNKQDQRTGYPVHFFVPCFDHLDSLLVDSNYLKHSLETQYLLPPALKSKIAQLPTPVTPAESRPSIHGMQPRKKIFWAGRLDRQKRFDLVIEIAKKLPDFDFHAWGMPVIGDINYDLSQVPKNLKMMGIYSKLDELPLSEATAWLYTSAWDGIPTILLEVGVRGIPLVASRVGGTGEVVSEETAWPIDAIEDCNAYIAAIKNIAENPQETEMRTQKMRQWILDRHNPRQYQQQLFSALSHRVDRHD